MNFRATLRRWSRATTAGVAWILGVTIGVHVLLTVVRLADAAWGQWLFEHLALQPDHLLTHGPQGLLTMALVHDPWNFLHILMNVLGLWFLGPWVERALGTKRFVTLYVVSAVAGSVVYVGWTYFASAVGLPPRLGDPGTPAVGASGAVLGILAAFSLLYPDAQVRLWFVAPMSAKHLIWLAVAVDLIFAIAPSNDTAVSVHLGGILGAWLWLRRPWKRGRVRRPPGFDPFRGQRRW